MNYGILVYMKNFMKSLLAGIIAPVFAVSFLQNSVSVNANKDVIIQKAAMPYIVDVVEQSGKTTELAGTSKSLDAFDIATDLGAAPFQEDKFSAFPDIKMGIGSKITLYRAPSFTIIDGKKKSVVRSWAKNVGDLITDAKLPELGVDDKVNFSLTTETEDGMQIRITRVAKTTVIETQSISFNVTQKPNPNLEKGIHNVLQAGSDGSKKNYYAVTREDGVQVSKIFTKSEVVTQPVDEIMEVGTKVVVYGSGKATWYKRIDKMVAASNTLPKGTKVNVINLANGKSCVVTIDDTGIQGDAVIDLSADAFASIGSLGSGIVKVRIEKYYPND